LPVTLGSQVQVRLAGLLGLLLEAMQHVDRTGELRHIDDPERTGRVPDSNFLGSLPNGRHRLPVLRLAPVLYLVQLVTGLAPCRNGEGAQVIESTAPEFDRLGTGHPGKPYKILYIVRKGLGPTTEWYSNGSVCGVRAAGSRHLRPPRHTPAAARRRRASPRPRGRRCGARRSRSGPPRRAAAAPACDA